MATPHYPMLRIYRSLLVPHGNNLIGRYATVLSPQTLSLQQYRLYSSSSSSSKPSNSSSSGSFFVTVAASASRGIFSWSQQQQRQQHYISKPWVLSGSVVLLKDPTAAGSRRNPHLTDGTKRFFRSNDDVHPPSQTSPEEDAPTQSPETTQQQEEEDKQVNHHDHHAAETSTNPSSNIEQELSSSTSSASSSTSTSSTEQEYTEKITIELPDVGDIHAKGKILKWYKQQGDIVRPNDTICDIETDLFTFGMDVEDENEGIMKEILVPEGEEGLKPGTPICTIMHKPMK